ncbi:E3 SUMO-protein ligase ZBED1-like [Ostrea edulis]|uniref:E3 SUMO-protein ligase ZBED1-like n=1 Tax=Ostrea edulis TaxID=37623 RepID=UPI0024AF085E|nr:E3 SUMO-protein ligase ZBED1-like [Ostrea edulis]
MLYAGHIPFPPIRQTPSKMEVADTDFEIVPNKRAKSSIWKQFGLKKRKSDGRIEESVAICKLCDSVIKCAGGGTSNLTAHLRRHHPLQVTSTATATSEKSNAASHGFQPQSLTVAGMFANRQLYKSSSPKAVDITQKIAKFLVKDLRPYRMVDSPEFRDIINALNPRYQVPSRKQFSEAIIPKMYNAVKENVLKTLSSATQVAITSDGWTSRSTESYVTVTATFVDANWEMQNYVLQTRPMPESHTAENVASVIREACKEWKLPSPLGPPPLVSDNAANMLKAGQIIGCIHIGGLAHTLNLAAQRSLKVKTVSNLLARIRTIVAFFHRSTVAASVLKAKAELLAIPNHKLKIDVCTRWNSTFDMIERFLEMQAAVIASLRCKELSHIKNKDISNLSDESVSLAENIAACLKPLKDMTTMLCTESTPTLSVIMPLHRQLITNILVAKEDDSHTVVEMKKLMKNDLESRYADKKDFLNMVSAIDPRFKSLPYLTDEEKTDVFDHVTQEAVRLAGAKLKPFVVKTEKEDENTSTIVQPNLPLLPALPGDSEIQIKNETVVETSSKTGTFADSSCVLHDILGDVFVTLVEPPKSSLELVQMEVINYKSEPSIPLKANPLN